MKRPSSSLRDRLMVVLGLVLIAGGCAGNGCSCMAPLPDGFPSQDRHPNAIQARLSSTGVQFMEENASTLVSSLVGMGMGLTFDIPPSCGGDTEICCGEPPGSCQILIDMDAQPGDPPRLELTPRDPPGNQLGLLARARVQTNRALPFTYKVIGIPISCNVQLDTTAQAPPSITLTTNIDFVQDPTVGTTRITVGTVEVTDLDDGDIDISGGFQCDIVDFFKGFFVDQIVSGITDQIQTTIEDQVCKQCDVDANCSPFATCNADGVCELNDSGGQRCLQELGASGRLFAADLLASLSPGQQGAMDIYDVAGGYARSNGDGLSLGILGGAVPADGRHDPCVPPSDPPAMVAMPESAVFQGNSTPGGVPFDIALGMHEYYLNLNGWAAYESGFLCANVGTRSIALLNSATFVILVPSLVDLLHGETAPLILALRPQQKPVMTLGLGTFTTNSSGEKVIDDPLITIGMPELEIDFYAMLDERYVRLFTLRADVTLPVGLDVNEQGQLVPILGDLGNAFQNLAVTNSELLLETPQEIADRFPAVLEIALPFVADALGAIDLPAFSGVQVKLLPGGITSVENQTMLAIFGELEVAPAGKPRRIETTATVLGVTAPPAAAYDAERLDPAARTVVELAFGADADGVEWQYRIDGGLWSPYTASPRVTLSRKLFWLQGRHVVEVRAREVGRPETTDAEPAVVEVLVDSFAPEIVLFETEGAVRVDARDLVSPAEQLAVSYRFAGGEWRLAGPAPAEIPLGAANGAAELEVVVTDEAGNVATRSTQIVGFHGRVPASGDGCGCRVGARDASRGGAAAGGLVLLAGALVLGASRRRALLALVALALLAAAVGCGGASSGSIDAGNAVKPGPIGRWSDLAAADGRVVVSAYEELYGDLVLVEYGESGVDSYTVVDGVPSGGAVVLNPDGYRGGVTEAGDDVGAWTSVALTGGAARIAYQDRGAGALKFAIEEGQAWTTHVVDPGMGAVVGLYASLTIDAGGVPGIAYMAHAIDDGMGGKRAQLRWAQASSAAPKSEADWSVAIVAEVGIPCTGLCGDPDVSACVVASNRCEPVAATCAPECSGDTACVGGACVDIIPLPEAVDLPEGTGLFASAGRLPDGAPVVAFYDRTTGDLRLAYRDAAGAWQLAPLDAAPETDRGQWASLAVGADGTVHVAYQDALGDRMMHVTWSGGVAGAPEVVDDGLRDPDRPHPVGASAALVVDAQGGLAVAYQDEATSDLLFARRDASGAWTRADLMAGDEGFGFFVAAAVDGATVWVSNYVYDREFYPPGVLRVTTLP